MATYFTGGETMNLAEFTAIMAKHGWIARTPKEGETEQATDLLFERAGQYFAAWQEGPVIGATRYPDNLQEVVHLYRDGTEGYRRWNGGDDE